MIHFISNEIHRIKFRKGVYRGEKRSICKRFEDLGIVTRNAKKAYFFDFEYQKGKSLL